jgi:hypothetical protein
LLQKNRNATSEIASGEGIIITFKASEFVTAIQQRKAPWKTRETWHPAQSELSAEVQRFNVGFSYWCQSTP